jgi:hypothetical protein
MFESLGEVLGDVARFMIFIAPASSMTFDETPQSTAGIARFGTSSMREIKRIAPKAFISFMV